MKITDYMPELYENNIEMKALLNSEQIEFETNLKSQVENVFKNTFAKTANLKGIEDFEAIFNITPDTSTETLEFRRARIFNRLITQIPFTERFLQSKLDEILGKNTNSDFTPSNPNNNQWYYIINYNDYTLDIYIAVPGRGWLNELKEFLASTIPCNIEWQDDHIHIFAASWQQVKESFSTWQDVKDEGTWSDIQDALWLNN